MGALKFPIELNVANVESSEAGIFPKCRFNNPQKFIMNEAEIEENQYYDDLYNGINNYGEEWHSELKQIYHQLVMDGMIVC